MTVWRRRIGALNHSAVTVMGATPSLEARARTRRRRRSAPSRSTSPRRRRRTSSRSSRRTPFSSTAAPARRRRPSSRRTRAGSRAASACSTRCASPSPSSDTHGDRVFGCSRTPRSHEPHERDARNLIASFVSENNSARPRVEPLCVPFAKPNRRRQEIDHSMATPRHCRRLDVAAAAPTRCEVVCLPAAVSVASPTEAAVATVESTRSGPLFVRSFDRSIV